MGLYTPISAPAKAVDTAEAAARAAADALLLPKAGGTMTGKLTAAADSAGAKLNVGASLGAAPLGYVSGDLWMQSNRLTLATGTSTSITTAGINQANVFSQTQGIDANHDSSPALMITQRGLGDSLRVADIYADPTPFRITSDGRVAIGVATGESLDTALTVDSTGIKFSDGTKQTVAFTDERIATLAAVTTHLTDFTTLGAKGKYIIAYPGDPAHFDTNPGDDLNVKYAAAVALNPTATDRATLYIMPGSYTFASYFRLTSAFVDVVGVGSTTHTPQVHIVQDLGVEQAVRVEGLGIVGHIWAATEAIQTFVNCTTTTRAASTDPVTRPYAQNADGGSFCLGGPVLSSFIGCVGVAYSFASNGNNFAGTATDCIGGNYCFGGNNGSFTGTATNCSAGYGSFGGGYLGSFTGTAINCSTGGDGYSFGLCSPNIVTAGGVIMAPGKAINCTSGVDSWSGTGTILSCADRHGKIYGGVAVTSTISLTQSDYDAMATKDAKTLYLIV